MYTVEQINQMVAVKRTEVEALVAQGIIPQEVVEPTMALYVSQLQAQQAPVVEGTPAVEAAPVVDSAKEADAKAKEAGKKVLGMFGKKEGAMRFEYREITELFMPKLSEENNKKAVKLANDIELLRVSISERTKQGIIVPDAELESLNNMKKAFKKLTRTDYYKALTTVAKKGGTKVVEWTSTIVEEMDARTNQFITDIEGTICDTIAGVEDLATLTVGFTSNLAQGSVKVAGTASKGILKAGFGLLKSRKNK